MNVVRSGGVEIAANADLLKCVELAMDLSAARRGEIEVLRDGEKVGGFTNGHRTYPAIRDEPGGLPCLNLAALESIAIEEAMKRSDGHYGRAAKLLGIGRTTLYRKLERRNSIEEWPQTFGNVLTMRRAA